jgi:amino acid adenylation domain-containing protein
MSRLEQLVERQASARPEKCVVQEHTGRALSYRQLWQESGRLAATLARLGIGRGHAVAVALDRSIELVVAVLGIARSGAAYVLLDPQSPPARNQLMVDEVDARALVEPAVRPTWSPSCAGHHIVLPLEETAPLGAVPPAGGGDDEDILYYAFTSGSTGRPKGVVVPHRAVAHFVLEPRLCSLSPRARVASLSSPASDATTLEIWKPLALGATVVVLPHPLELEAHDWPVVLQDSGVSTMFMMAGLVELICRDNPAVFASVDTLVFGGEALNPATARRICEAGPPRHLVLGYGPTETTVFASSFECTPRSLDGRDRIPLGSPLGGYSLLVLDEQRRSVDPGAVGELYVGGPAVARGYVARPELTAERFVALPGHGTTYRSGDFVRQHPDGLLEFVGRVDRQVKLRGHRIELEEVERAVLATGKVDRAVVELLDGEGPAHLVCFYQASASTGAGAGDLAFELPAALSRRLPGYMIPARWMASDLPLTSIGKVDRAGLVASLTSLTGEGSRSARSA